LLTLQASERTFWRHECPRLVSLRGSAGRVFVKAPGGSWALGAPTSRLAVCARAAAGRRAQVDAANSSEPGTAAASSSSMTYISSERVAALRKGGDLTEWGIGPQRYYVGILLHDKRGMAEYMSLREVVECTTVNAARAFDFGIQIGTLRPGAEADVAIFDLQDGEFTFVDSVGQTRNGRQRLIPAATVRGGKIFYPVRPSA